jgi:Flp pilus assembly protein TadG
MTMSNITPTTMPTTVPTTATAPATAGVGRTVRGPHAPYRQEGPSNMRWLHRDEGGQAAVEFMLMFPLVLVLLMFIIEFGFVLHTYVTVIQSAAEGARFAAIGKPPAAGACTPNDGTIQGRTVAVGSNKITCAEVTVRYPPPATVPVARGDIVAVKVNKTYTTVTPLGDLLTFVSWGTFPNTLPMTSCFDARLEQGPTVQTNVTIGVGCP